MTAQVLATNLTAAIADRLAVPAETSRSWSAQSLSRGAVGVALLHIERAHAATGTWQSAHTWVRIATSDEISAADSAGLYLGVPAISFVLHAVGDRYAEALESLDIHVINLAHRRIDAAMARIGRGEASSFAEYDLFQGLTGIGRLLLQHCPGSDALGRALDYLVHLTKPLSGIEAKLPGWWVNHDPDPLLPTPGGHVNLGLAHGIAGPLALLGSAMRRGITVDGHAEAINEIGVHLDEWGQDSDTGPWWPQWIAREDLIAGRVGQPGPLRPSWCYGTPGIARAQQIAAIATGDLPRQWAVEQALAACLSDSAQLARVTDAGLCHGWAGVYQTVRCAAEDALSPEIGTHLPRLAEALTRHAMGEDDNLGFLDGAAGVALALHSVATAGSPISGWDSCLLIS